MASRPREEEVSGLPGAPVIVSGVGGSGTRVVAEILARLGLFMGDDLNRSNDNMQLAALFPRIRNLLYRAHLRGDGVDPAPQVAELLGRFEAAMEADYRRQGGAFIGWGWKLPVSFLIIDQLHARYPGARFIHVVRHGLDMAFSRNRNQLNNWGWRFGIEPGPQQAPEQACLQLRYWIAANDAFRRYAAERLSRGQALMLRYDDLCRAPEPGIRDMADFVGADPAQAGELASLVRPPRSLGRYREHDTTCFSRAELEAVGSFGFHC